MSSDEWKKLNTSRYSVRITTSSRLPAAIKQYAADHGITETNVLVMAVKEKLQREGYWKPDSPQTYSGPYGRLQLPED